MGLDMYLHRKHYIYSEQLDNIELKGELAKGIDKDKITNITEEVMYWRKANHIHQWFVENVQNRADDCKDYYVTNETLKELLSVCKKVRNASKLIPGKIHAGSQYTSEGGHKEIIEDGKVIEDSTVAERLLPVQERFFFGSTNYDEGYLQDILNTIKGLEELFERDPDSDAEYSSSW